MARGDVTLEGWPEQFTASAARDFLNEKIRPWVEVTGRELGQFRPPLATDLGQNGDPPDEQAVSGEKAQNEGGEATPWFPEPAYWAFAPPPRPDRWRLTLDPGGRGAKKEPIANLIACAAWVARRQRVLDGLRQSGNKKLVGLLKGLQETLEGLAADSPELMTEPAFTAALVAASQVAPLVAIRTPSPSLEHGVRLDDVPTKLAWYTLTHGGFPKRLATVTVVALGLEGLRDDGPTNRIGDGDQHEAAANLADKAGVDEDLRKKEAAARVKDSYRSLWDRLRNTKRRDDYLPAAVAHLRGARFAPGPLEALELLRIYGRLEAPDTVGLRKCFVVDLAARHLGRERGELPQDLGSITAVLTPGTDAGLFGGANSVPLSDIAEFVERARRRHNIGSFSVAELEGTALGRVPGAAVAWVLRSRASLSGREEVEGIALVMELSELFGEGVALNFLSHALSTLGDPSSA